MKNKIKKWHIALMSFMALFIAIFASLFSLRADTVDEETGEIVTDNWVLDIVFYDSSVDKTMMNTDGTFNEDGKKTPLTSINWDASDGSYKDGEPRIIVIQINYKNNNAITTYQPGELEISIPNLVYDSNIYKSSSNIGNTYYCSTYQILPEIIIGANDYIHSGFEWNLTNTYFSNIQASPYDENHTFTNTNTIEENSNFEGSIQIIYNIKPIKESSSSIYEIEKYEDECIHSYSKNINAKLSYIKTINNTQEQIEVLSNTIPFSYTRIYTHPWQKETHTITKSATKITSYDGLATNPEQYIWVKYIFKISGDQGWDSYPEIGMTFNTSLIYDTLPEGCVMYKSNGEQILGDENGVHIIDNTNKYENSYNYALRAVYVGYPKSIYNDQNLLITNTAEYYGYYNDNPTNLTYLNTASVSVNLTDFEFTYSGSLFGIQKEKRYSDLRYQDIINNWEHSEVSWNIKPVSVYTGSSLTVRIGDDLLYASDKNNNYMKLNDNEFYFSSIYMYHLYNGNNNLIPKGKYNCELWLRYAEQENYILYEEFTNGSKTLWNFTKDNQVVGWYIQINDMHESLNNNSYISSYTIFNKNEIPETGELYNFCYMQVFTKDNNGNLILQNEPQLNSYSNTMTQLNIASYDQATYSKYLQRAEACANWAYYNVPQPEPYIAAYKDMSNNIIQDNENEQFSGTMSLGAQIIIAKEYQFESNYSEQYSAEYAITGFKVYDLLPFGIELSSTETEIINSISCKYSWASILCNLEGKQLSKQEIVNIIKTHSIVSIVPNWNNTGRTRIEITAYFPDCPMFVFCFRGSVNHTEWCYLYYNCNYNISYEAFLEYGKSYTNYCYVDRISDDLHVKIKNTCTDNGFYDSFASDINDNQNILETISFTKDSITITSVVSTHQDVTTYVKTDQSNYSTGIVDASCNSEYEYKLRVRTGSADITNLVIYTSIEEAQPERTRWYGEFLGVDTTYAENKGYTVKVWYSPNITLGTLADDTSWQVYDETTVDKSKVKSLAFQYLVETDDTTGTSTDTITPAILPANSLTYVLIKMKAPNDESIKTLARMDCWTQWNALDDYDQPVDFITGINSNVVKVALPNSIKADDLPSISLKFIKEIQGETSDFENLNLNKADEYIFMIRLTSLSANDDGTYNQVTGLLSSTQGLVITKIPTGTYLLEELCDNYFDFVNFTDNNDPELIIEGVTFEKTDQGYIITVSEDLSETVEFNIKVTNKTEDERYYEDKEYKENLFLKNKLESSESGEDPETPI